MSGPKGPIIGLRPKKRREAFSGEIKPVCNNPLERLCEKLLDWNFYEQCCLAATTKTKDMPVKPFHNVPTVFESYNEYIEVWEPLVFDEIRANVLNNFAARLKRVRSKEFQFSVSENKLKESNLMTLETQFLPPNKNNLQDDRNDYPITMDLVLFSPTPFDGSIFCPEEKDRTSSAPSSSSAGSSDATQKKPPPNLLLGIVVGTNQSTSSARTFQVRVITNSWENFKSSIKPTHVPRQTGTTTFHQNSGSSGSNPLKMQNRNGHLTFTMHYTIVESIRSNWREFLALHELRSNIPLLNEVLGTAREMDMVQTPPLPTEDALDFHSSATAAQVASQVAAQSQGIRIPIDQEVEAWRMEGVTDKFMRYLRSKYNNSQLYAIRTSTSQMGFTLIQGPPGTGKTSTIIGILNAIHIREYNRHYEEALYTVLGPVGLNCRNSNSEVNWLQLVSRLAKKKPHILVVAPSNVAVDNIIERIMEDGFIDGNGGRYFPNMLRVGGGKTPRVQSVSLEDTMKQEEQDISRSADRMSHLVDLNVQISKIIADIVKCQTLLFDLKIAFDAHFPLPEGWELRMSTKTGLPYWVDHNLKRTSTTPPVIVKPEPGMPPRTRYSRIDFLPEFIVHSHRMTQLIDNLDICNMKRTRLQTIMQNLSSSLARGGSDVYNGNGGMNTTSLQGRELLESSIIDSAQLLFTTLNSSGHPSMEATEFCVTVIDEAANCVEPSVLIALRRGCKQCIMVGDQQQLPATTFSTSAKAAGYERSLFERLVNSGQPYIMLDTQYRMTPQISAFPSTAFYFSNLRDGANVTAEGYLPAHFDPRQNPTALLRPFMLLDLASSKETGDTTSKANPEEAQLVVQLLWTLIAEAERCGSRLGSVGVITPYSVQLEMIRSMLVKARLMRPGNNSNNNNRGSSGRDGGNNQASAESRAGFHDIECNTVDGFQGREKDVIIISAVRANDQGQIGFLSETRRLNVALTRAKYGLFVIGHAATLKNNYFWDQMIDHAKRCNSLVEVPDSRVNLQRVFSCSVAATSKQQGYQDFLSRQYQTSSNSNSSSASSYRDRPYHSDVYHSSNSSGGGGGVNNGSSRPPSRPSSRNSNASSHERPRDSDGNDEQKAKKSRVVIELE